MTQNLPCEAPQRAFGSRKRGFVNKELRQKLEVDIPLTNNLLASVLLGAPQVGGAIYLVEKALGTKIIKVGKTDRIEGSFDDPKVTLLPPFVKQRL